MHQAMSLLNKNFVTREDVESLVKRGEMDPATAQTLYPAASAPTGRPRPPP